VFGKIKYIYSIFERSLMLTKGAFLFDQNNSKSKKKNSNIVNIAQETFEFS